MKIEIELMACTGIYTHHASSQQLRARNRTFACDSPSDYIERIFIEFSDYFDNFNFLEQKI